MEATKRILIVTLSNIGDVILTTPVITSLAARYPEAKITVVTSLRAEGVLEGSRFIHDIVIYNKKSGLSGQLRFLNQLRRHRYDLVVDLRRTAIAYLVRAKRRSPLFRHYRQMSMRNRHLEVLGMMKLECPEAPQFDFFSKVDDNNALEKVHAEGLSTARDWILVAPVAASELKTWRLDGFRDLLRGLLRERSEDILLVGDMRERELAAPLVDLNPKRIRNLAGRTTLPELAALIARASLLIANDSAAMHLGYELNRPVVALFGPTHYKKSGYTGEKFRIVREPVECSPCERPRCRFARQACFEDLKADKVMKACEELLRVHTSS
ncbi:MAG: glycosyltransferase family 9 protein [Candidatus Omnitrophota bacterium]|nr:glycosyltransferase family 9 protein [Candidatus Omnitrophota bacterium]